MILIVLGSSIVGFHIQDMVNVANMAPRGLFGNREYAFGKMPKRGTVNLLALRLRWFEFSPAHTSPPRKLGSFVWQAILRRSPTRIRPKNWRSMPFEARLTERRRAGVLTFDNVRHLASSAASYGKPYSAEAQRVSDLKTGEVCPSKLG